MWKNGSAHFNTEKSAVSMLTELKANSPPVPSRTVGESILRSVSPLRLQRGWSRSCFSRLWMNRRTVGQVSYSCWRGGPQVTLPLFLCSAPVTHLCGSSTFRRGPQSVDLILKIFSCAPSYELMRYLCVTFNSISVTLNKMITFYSWDQSNQ